MCKIKKDEGLGFKKLREFNVAMLAKQAWRLINNSNALVTAVMKSRYYMNTDFMEATLGDNPRFMWHSVTATHDMIKKGCRRKIDDGRDTRIWKIMWLPCTDNGCLTREMCGRFGTDDSAYFNAGQSEEMGR